MAARMAAGTGAAASEGAAPVGADKSILRWGGLAGMAAGILFVLVPVILFGFAPAAPDPAL